MFILFFITCPALLCAAPRTVTITWTKSDTTDVQGYKVYYADNNAMINKTWCNDCSDPIENPANTFTITCYNVEIKDNQPYYFTIAALMNDNSESTSNPTEKTYIVSHPTPSTAVQDFKIIIQGENITPSVISNYAINFQPTDASVPDSYIADSGLEFNTQSGYGWTVLPGNVVVDRNSSKSPDQRYDTLVRVMNSLATWEITVPNGNFEVTVCMGDPVYPVGEQNVQVEGVPIIQGESISSSVLWISKTKVVEVVDGRITLTFDNSGDLGKICWIEIQNLVY